MDRPELSTSATPHRPAAYAQDGHAFPLHDGDGVQPTPGVDSAASPVAVDWFDSVPHLVWSARADGTADCYNRRWCDYTGSPAGGPCGPWLDCVHPDDRDAARAAWQACVDGGETFEAEFRLRGADGHYRWHLARCLPVLDTAGHVARFTGTFTDIDDRKTAELSLRAAKDQSDNAGRAKDEFLSIVSHELRTPLSAILGWTQLLEMDVLDEAERREAIQTIKQQAKAQTQLIEDLLDVSRILNDKFYLRQQDTELGQIVSAALHAVRPVAAQSGVTIREGEWDSALVVRGDPQRLQQVVSNLLHNAVKFTPKDGTIEVTITPAEPGAALVTVRDSGLGIPVDQIEAIFERFKQVGSEAIRDKGGLGLGLSIVKHVVDAHGGTIRAKSEGVGQGSRFEMTLPTVTAAAGAPTQPSADIAPGVAALLGVRVLVVDDEESARTVIAAALSKAGAEVTTAAGVSAAWSLLGRQPFDVLVSDLGMPGETGLDLIARVRQSGVPFRGIPAIALTGFASVDDQTRALAAGFHVHVTKPVEPNELVRRILSATQAAKRSS